ncbi:M24 family metallopeptidase [Thalassotalea nanhaiensis]|uniref:M24 family metallopeptidase n=1 Tax=Thalassotalea nanhaiensis TaxID=3065648 RepID=A0ABY9TL33_9GAMM|nr:M24 family metallopeptidase [Colwelliaceae bacterium SQ345]
MQKINFFKKLYIFTTLIFVNSFTAYAEQDLGEEFNILSMQERSELVDRILSKRVVQLLPQLMSETNIDMWILISRENNEDAVLKTLLPSTWMGARRRTILMFTRMDDGTVKAEAMSRYDVGNVFKKAWDKESQPDQMLALIELIQARDPNRIALNQSAHYEIADGLVATERDLLFSYLPNKYRERIVSGEDLAVSWLETRIVEEVQAHQEMVALTKAIIRKGFSNAVIRPRKTTVGDLVWWFRDEVSKLGLQTWFQPSVRLQRKYKNMAVSEDPDLIILPGDLLHVDFGISYLRLNTDIQQHAYVLKPEEKRAPKFLINALNVGNKLQDILTSNFEQGISGNEILSKSREQALLNGIKPMIYSHPIGFHGHAAGTTIGKWDSQHGVPGEGDRLLRNNTAYAIELNATVYSEEWQKDIVIMLEENALFSQGKVNYLAPRQEELILVNYK